MEGDLVSYLARLRLAVGCLGEHEDYRWWNCSFTTPNSAAFLGPVFARTIPVAQYHGLKEAATRVHDKHIGIGRVHHLFRLPEDIEQGIFHVIGAGSSLHGISRDCTDPETALGFLSSHVPPVTGQAAGPVWVGDLASARVPASWRTVSGHYTQAFRNGIRVFPYFADRT